MFSNLNFIEIKVSNTVHQLPEYPVLSTRDKSTDKIVFIPKKLREPAPTVLYNLLYVYVYMCKYAIIDERI